MNETQDQVEEPSNRNVRLNFFRFLFWGIAVSIVLALILIIGLHWQQASKTNETYDSKIPFHPSVTYDSLSVTITNTEAEPYLNTSLNLYVGAILYSAYVGTIPPGESVTRSVH